MPKPRNKQIALSETPFYHLTYRCVRRSFLCGEIDGCNFEHRREWIVERLKLLTEMFAINVASYAIMINHENFRGLREPQLCKYSHIY